MTTYSTRALAAALVIGTIGAGALAPAIAKDKNAAPAGPVMTAAVRTALLAADAALKSGDIATATTSATTAEAAAKTDDDRYWVARTRLNIIATRSQQNAASVTPTETIPALTAVIDSPKLPPEELPKLLASRASEEAKAHQYQQATADLSRARQLGYSDPDSQIQMVEAKVKSGDVAGGLADLKAAASAEIAAGRKPPQAWYDFAITQAQRAHLRPQMIEWLVMRANAFQTPSYWHDAIVLVGLDQVPQTPADKQRAVDLYRLLHFSKTMADTVEYRGYVTYSLEAGDPYEAKAVLTEASSLGKLPTTQIENAATMKRANVAIAANGTLASLETRANSGSGGAAIAAGDAYYGSGNYTKAAAMYRLAVQKGGDTNLANLRLGEALAVSGDKAGAAAAFGAVAPTSPQGEAAVVWNGWINRTGG